MHSTTYILAHPLRMQWAQLRSPCIMHRASCTVHRAPCTVHYTPCSPPRFSGLLSARGRRLVCSRVRQLGLRWLRRRHVEPGRGALRDARRILAARGGGGPIHEHEASWSVPCNAPHHAPFHVLCRTAPAQEKAPPDPQASRDDPLFVELRAAQLRGASTTRTLCAARNMPCRLPAPAVALLDALLCVDPACRPTIEEVRCHAWLAQPRPSPLMAMISSFFACIPAAKPLPAV